MEMTNHYVIFTLDSQRYALALTVVEYIVRAVEVTPLPDAPAIVLGAIDVKGEVLPVLNLRRRFMLPEREIGPDDQFLIAYTSQRSVVLVIDEAQGVIECDPSAIISADQIAPGLERFKGVVQLDDGLVLIHDLDRFLSLDEEQSLGAAMDQVE